MTVFIVIVESIMLASSCSLDAFTASFAYGANGITIPASSCQVINLICSSIFALSLLIGAFLRQYLPSGLTVAIAFTVLFVIGIMKLMDGITKSIIKRFTKNQKPLAKEVKFTLFNVSFILNLYANPEEADINDNKIISASEASLLAFSLSMDGFASGFGAALGNVNIIAAILTSLIANTLAIYTGCTLGKKLSHKLTFNVSWLSGVILIFLAITKIW